MGGGAVVAASRPCAEQPAEVEACRAAYARTPTALLEECGALSEHFTASTSPTPPGPTSGCSGAARATCCLCPTTERDLADGIGRAREIADAGAALSLGSDSHAVIDHFEEMRALELDERLVTTSVGFTARLSSCAREPPAAIARWAGPTPAGSSPAPSLTS